MKSLNARINKMADTRDMYAYALLIDIKDGDKTSTELIAGTTLAVSQEEAYGIAHSFNKDLHPDCIIIATTVILADRSLLD